MVTSVQIQAQIDAAYKAPPSFDLLAGMISLGGRNLAMRAIVHICPGQQFTLLAAKLCCLRSAGFIHIKGQGGHRYDVLKYPDGRPFDPNKWAPPGGSVTIRPDGVRVTRYPPGHAWGCTSGGVLDDLT